MLKDWLLSEELQSTRGTTASKADMSRPETWSLFQQNKIIFH